MPQATGQVRELPGGISLGGTLRALRPGNVRGDRLLRPMRTVDRQVRVLRMALVDAEAEMSGTLRIGKVLIREIGDELPVHDDEVRSPERSRDDVVGLPRTRREGRRDSASGGWRKRRIQPSWGR